VPEPDPRYGERVWNRLRAELADDRARPWWKGLGEGLAGALAPSRLRTAAAVAAVAAVAFAAGRYRPPAEVAEDRPLLTAEARERIVTDVVAEHLERSERLLLDLVHGPEEISAGELEDVRSRIDDVLFKVQVIGFRLRHQGPAIPPVPSRDRA
jgi:hypothetical protein